jgi:drug/metabolite transporter (DMT)-like permease
MAAVFTGFLDKIKTTSAGSSFFIVLAAILWSTDALLRQPLTRDLSALVIVLSEHGLALIFVLPVIIAWWPTIKRLQPRQWWAILFIGLAASALATVAFTASFSYVSPSVSILLQKLQPLVTFFVAWLWLGESRPRWFWWWAALAIVGAYLISFPELIPQLTIYSQGLKGIGLAVLAALIWGSATVAGRYLLRDLPFLLVAALRFVVAFIFLAFLLSGQVMGSNWSEFLSISSRDWLFLIIIMLGPGWGAMYLYYRGLAATKATVSAVLELTWPLAAVALNWIVLDERLVWMQIIGALMLSGAISRLTIWPTKSLVN